MHCMSVRDENQREYEAISSKALVDTDNELNHPFDSTRKVEATTTKQQIDQLDTRAITHH